MRFVEQDLPEEVRVLGRRDVQQLAIGGDHVKPLDHRASPSNVAPHDTSTSLRQEASECDVGTVAAWEPSRVLLEVLLAHPSGA